MAIQVINPATGELVKEYPEMSLEQAEGIVDELHQAYLHSTVNDFAFRAKCIKKAAELLRKKSEEYARLILLEMGKPVKEGIAEILKCAWACDYFAEHAEKFLQKEFIKTDASKSYITYEPLGVVLAIMPWNFPFWQVFRFAVPVLMAGNGAALKHAANVPGCALAIEEIFREAGFHKNLFRTLLINNSLTETIIENPKIAAVALTGSTAAGRIVASKAGACLKKTILELGGSDPYLVLEDADLEQAAAICTEAKLNNTGQSCIAAKRIILVKSISKDFEKLLIANMQKYKMGNAGSDELQIGPLARNDLRLLLDRQVKSSIAKGAKCLLGGQIPEGKGFYYPPTILSEVKMGMPAYDEELFGPAVAIITARNEEEAITIANDTSFGLGACVFSKNIVKAEEIATKKIQAGSCFVNGRVRSDPRLPFGGIKQSGHGRELSFLGIREFTNVKTVVVC